MSELHDTHTERGLRAKAKLADDEKLRELLEAREKLNAQIRAKRGEGKTKERKARNRRGILIGLAVMDALERSPTAEEKALILRWLDRWLTKPAERALFHLPALPQRPELVVDNPGAAHDADGTAGGDAAALAAESA
jgi:hypothetical protein